ncbi:glycosyltransferase family 2 protein [Aliivibrio sp. S3MY1]|uniref:glycosyltransferase family 2 protein n=1 Tax=unclassified Aliivibrio TaxID=2645654 RepID=UPI002378A039|nr:MULTISPECIES: glycosyltransferase family 2 protein [unclassified Aliivibrio]MDD9196717.1 glycosyltransferase family 2 protein [Aliivibrio sp. S3MY1]MDD9199792.1 glycosyltransferase family 2 protein [Aliivibrio sp. S2MY1]
MKVSIITVCYNSEKTIEDTLKSVQSQCYSGIEYIVIDGGSKDSTNEIISKYKDIVSVHISEQDNGLYDAMNKGIALATGDIVGVLNSDDIFVDESVVQNLVNSIGDNSGIYADVGFYSEHDFSDKKRHYSSKGFVKSKFSRGMMPAHPSFYVRKECYEKAGLYRTDFKIASDFDMVLRIFSLPNTSFAYLEKEIVKMRLGGVSTSGFMSNYVLNKEILDSCQSNGIKASWFSILSKYPSKMLGYIFK